MSPKYQHKNFGDVQNHIFAKGVITAVDSENDTADVTVQGYQDGTGVPLFYHCEPDSEKRGNGAIKGAAAAFNVDDEVIVMLEVDGPPVRIVGFVDGIRECQSLADISFTINGKTPTKPHTLQVVDSTPEEEDGPLMLAASSTVEEPNIVKGVDLTGFVFPIKIYLMDLVEYYRPDIEGMTYFYAIKTEVEWGDNTTYTYYIGKAAYDEKNPPDPAEYDYFERATRVNKTLGATYDKAQNKMVATFTVYTLQMSQKGRVIDVCGCSLIEPAEPNLSSSAISNVNGWYPINTKSHFYGWTFCDGDENIGKAGNYDIGRTHGSVDMERPYIESDEDGLNASFVDATISVDWWMYAYIQQWYNNVSDDPVHGEVICEDRGSISEAEVWTWTMVPIQDKYI